MTVCYLPILRGSNVDRFHERKWFTFLAKARGRRYSARTITDAHSANDIAPLAKRAAGGIGLHVDPDTAGFMCFNQRRHLPIK